MDKEIITIKKRQDYGMGGQRISLHLPQWMIDVIDQEAGTKGETRAKVIAYLIYSGLKAHTGEFIMPGRNTIKASWLKRGKKWGTK